MACFVVPVTEAIITTTAARILKKREEKSGSLKEQNASDHKSPTMKSKIPFSRKLGWLNNLLWGGSFLLAFEHLWHGELVPWFPFLTAAGNPADTAEMLHEMATVGVSMTLLVTAVWFGMVIVSSILERKAAKDAAPTIEEKLI